MGDPKGGGREGNLRGWIQNEWNRSTLVASVVTGWLITSNSYIEMVIGSRTPLSGSEEGGSHLPDCALRHLQKGMTQAFQGCVILDAKRQWRGSLQVRIALCQGSYRPRT